MCLVSTLHQLAKGRGEEIRQVLLKNLALPIDEPQRH